MGYRIFTDAQGDEWQAWDIVPRLADRRVNQRRLTLASVDGDRRGREDRRKVAGQRPRLSHGLTAGWLCFQNPEQKRRLAPVPGDWLSCPVATLEGYLDMARPVPRMNTNVELPVIARIDRRAG